MASTPESKVKASVNVRLTLYGACWVDFIGSQYAANGISDKLACVQGRFFAIEVKAGDNMPTALQIKYLREVHAAGGCALVVNENSLVYLSACLENPHRAVSNFEAFTTASVRAALDEEDATNQPTLRKRSK